MRRARLVLSLLAAVSALALRADGWRNLDDENHIAGRMCRAGYLTGKVVLLSRASDDARRMEEIWASFKTKAFVLLGAYDSAPAGVTFPVYAAATREGAPASPLVLFDATGRVAYSGADEREVTEALVTALTNVAAPPTEAAFRALLDFEIANLPAHAMIRYAAFQKAYPKIARDYAARLDEIAKTPGLKALVALVRLAETVKDARDLDAKKDARVRARVLGRIDEASKKYAFLKEAEDPRIAQEAKNALADLAWAKAAL